ncbi:MAG: hypothetical protein U1F50_00340 [Rubrivivax sp.]
MLARGWIAQKFISEKALQINHLHDRDRSMTGSSPVSALIGAAVEFLRGANRRFADG